MLTDHEPELTVPLSRWAGRLLATLADETGSERIAALSGQTLLAERGSANDFRINGKASAGLGASKLMPTRDGGWFALTILRPEDRELLPALFLGDLEDIDSETAIATAVSRHDCAGLVERGRALGLPLASAD